MNRCSCTVVYVLSSESAAAKCEKSPAILKFGRFMIILISSIDDELSVSYPIRPIPVSIARYPLIMMFALAAALDIASAFS